jgi:hypothetical protein
MKTPIQDFHNQSLMKFHHFELLAMGVCATKPTKSFVCFAIRFSYGYMFVKIDLGDYSNVDNLVNNGLQ